MMGGGDNGTIGAMASWVIGVIACVGIVFAIINGRRQRQRFNFPCGRSGRNRCSPLVGCAAVLGAVAVFNAYPMPIGLARQYAEAHNIPWPDGGLVHPARHRQFRC